MIVRKQKHIEFINQCSCVVDVDALRSAINWYQRSPTSRLKKIYIHGQYPAVSIHTEKLHVHRLLMCFWVGRILRRDEYVNHIDGNKLNASRPNLEILPASLHQSITNKGRKQTPEHIYKRANAMTFTRYGHHLLSQGEIKTELI